MSITALAEALSSGNFIVCQERCVSCGESATDEHQGVFCSDVCSRTYPILRWACTCGRFLREDDVCMRDFIDAGAYHGVSTEAHWHCSRCGFQQGEARLTEVGTAVADS